MELRKIFIELLQHYTNDAPYIEVLWHELLKKYSGHKRHYHNLEHLENMLAQLSFSKAHVRDWNAVLLALFYHDAVYNVLRHDNEERSAALATNPLQGRVPPAQLETCGRLILATKKHEWSDDGDSNLFTDADLSILGADGEAYDKYCKAVRKEYAVYPDFVYNRGRSKVLEGFLQGKRIFKTPLFFARYEAQARRNLRAELEQLPA